MGEVRHKKSFSGGEPFFVTVQLSMTVCPLGNGILPENRIWHLAK